MFQLCFSPVPHNATKSPFQHHFPVMAALNASQVFVSPLIVLTLSLLWLPFQATYAWTSSYSSLPAIPFGIATWRTSRWCDFNYSSSWNQVTSRLQTIPDFQRCFVGIERLVMFVVLSWCFAFEWVTYQINCIPPSKTETNLRFRNSPGSLLCRFVLQGFTAICLDFSLPPPKTSQYIYIYITVGTQW